MDTHTAVAWFAAVVAALAALTNLVSAARKKADGRRALRWVAGVASLYCLLILVLLAIDVSPHNAMGAALLVPEIMLLLTLLVAYVIVDW